MTYKLRDGTNLATKHPECTINYPKCISKWTECSPSVVSSRWAGCYTSEQVLNGLYTPITVQQGAAHAGYASNEWVLLKFDWPTLTLVCLYTALALGMSILWIWYYFGGKMICGSSQYLSDDANNKWHSLKQRMFNCGRNSLWVQLKCVNEYRFVYRRSFRGVYVASECWFVIILMV